MAAISPSQSSPVLQRAFQQLQVQEARRNAERAEAVAQSLSAKAADAQRSADRAQENARSLTVQADEARSVAGQARQGIAAMKSADAMRASLYSTAGQVSERIGVDVPEQVASSVEPAAPVLNTSGQVTGVVVNTTA